MTDAVDASAETNTIHLTRKEKNAMSMSFFRVLYFIENAVLNYDSFFFVISIYVNKCFANAKTISIIILLLTSLYYVMHAAFNIFDANEHDKLEQKSVSVIKMKSHFYGIQCQLYF